MKYWRKEGEQDYLSEDLPHLYGETLNYMGNLTHDTELVDLVWIRRQKPAS